MKKLFVYFNQKAICESPEQAEQFINSLQYRGNARTKISCSDHCKETLRCLFDTGKRDGYPITEIATTGCSTTRIKIYTPMGETLEEHQAAYDAKQLADNSTRMIKIIEARNKRTKELSEQKEGWYAVSIVFNRFKFNYGREENIPTESTFSGNIIAQSGIDAYSKTVATIEKDYQVINYPSSTSGNFSFEFLGVKTDEGYSIELWEQWKTEGAI